MGVSIHTKMQTKDGQWILSINPSGVHHSLILQAMQSSNDTGNRFGYKNIAKSIFHFDYWFVYFLKLAN